MICHSIKAMGESLDLVARPNLDAVAELAGAKPLRTRLQLTNRNRHPPSQQRASHGGEQEP